MFRCPDWIDVQIDAQLDCRVLAQQLQPLLRKSENHMIVVTFSYTSDTAHHRTGSFFENLQENFTQVETL